jgi:hypothetical protein
MHVQRRHTAFNTIDALSPHPQKLHCGESHFETAAGDSSGWVILIRLQGPSHCWAARFWPFRNAAADVLDYGETAQPPSVQGIRCFSDIHTDIKLPSFHVIFRTTTHSPSDPPLIQQSRNLDIHCASGQVPRAWQEAFASLNCPPNW